MANSFNTGQDCTVDLIDSNGISYSFDNIGGDLMHFEADFDMDTIRRRPISGSGIVKRRDDYKGCKGTMEIGRVNANIEQMFVNAQNIYRTGGEPITYTIHRTVQERDGSGTQSVFQYNNCTLRMSKGPGYTMGSDVTMTIEFEGDDIVVSQ